VLKAPIQSQCASVGLRGCEDLTDGVLLYVEGDKDGAAAAIKTAVTKNNPAALQAFAGKLRMLRSIPGADQYIEPIMKVADMLSGSIPQSPVASYEPNAMVTYAPMVVPPSVQPPIQPTNNPPSVVVYEASEKTFGLTEVSVPSIESGSKFCSMYEHTAWSMDDSRYRCTKLLNGEVTLTDVQTSGACPDKLVIGAGDPSAPHWMLVAQPNTVLSVHGANFIVSPSESLFVAQGVKVGTNYNYSAACAIVWSIQTRRDRNAPFNPLGGRQ
jgi:hypothetical protein